MGRSVAGKGRFDGRRVEGEAGYKEVRGGKTFEGDIDEEGEAVFEGRVEEGQRRRLAPFVASSSFLLRLLFLSFIHADTRADPSPHTLHGRGPHGTTLLRLVSRPRFSTRRSGSTE